eukprot:scaffold18293_cov68-Phaeocystis_antarctica.AAC.4
MQGLQDAVESLSLQEPTTNKETTRTNPQILCRFGCRMQCPGDSVRVCALAGEMLKRDKASVLSRKVRSLLSRHVNRRPLLAQTKVRRACLASRRPWMTFSLDSAATCSSGAERKMELRPSVSHTQKRGRATARLATGGDGA